MSHVMPIITKTKIVYTPGGTGVLWWLYAKQRISPKDQVLPEQLQIAEDNLRALLIYAISATVFTVSTRDSVHGEYRLR